MKKLNLFFGILIGLLIFISCSNDTEADRFRISTSLEEALTNSKYVEELIMKLQNFLN